MSNQSTITAVVRNRVGRGQEHVIFATAEQVTEARTWVSECEWLDADCLDEYSSQEIVRGVDRHYDGGWTQFCKDAA